MKNLCILAVIFACSIAQAAEIHARIDIKGTLPVQPGKVTIGGSCENPGWVREDLRGNYIYAASAVLEGEDWTEFEFSFTPQEDGDVRLNICGPWFDTKKGETPVWIAYDNIEVTGATLTGGNGDFAAIAPNRKPVGWIMVDTASLVTESGNNYIKACFGKDVYQPLSVTAGKEVTVKMKIKKVQ